MLAGELGLGVSQLKLPRTGSLLAATQVFKLFHLNK
jgi:hypothetical protein